MTEVHFACLTNNTQMLQELLADPECDVNAQDSRQVITSRYYSYQGVSNKAPS